MIARSKDDLGKLLVDEQLITTRRPFDKAAAQADRTGDSLQKVLITLGLVSEKDVVEAMGRQMGVKFVDLSDMHIDRWLARSQNT